jgi:hypothetical protein
MAIPQTGSITVSELFIVAPVRQGFLERTRKLYVKPERVAS